MLHKDKNNQWKICKAKKPYNCPYHKDYNSCHVENIEQANIYDSYNELTNQIDNKIDLLDKYKENRDYILNFAEKTFYERVSAVLPKNSTEEYIKGICRNLVLDEGKIPKPKYPLLTKANIPEQYKKQNKLNWDIYNSLTNKLDKTGLDKLIFEYKKNKYKMDKIRQELKEIKETRSNLEDDYNKIVSYNNEIKENIDKNIKLDKYNKELKKWLQEKHIPLSMIDAKHVSIDSIYLKDVKVDKDNKWSNVIYVSQDEEGNIVNVEKVVSGGYDYVETESGKQIKSGKYQNGTSNYKSTQYFTDQVYINPKARNGKKHPLSNTNIRIQSFEDYGNDDMPTSVLHTEKY